MLVRPHLKNVPQQPDLAAVPVPLGAEFFAADAANLNGERSTLHWPAAVAPGVHPLLEG